MLKRVVFGVLSAAFWVRDACRRPHVVVFSQLPLFGPTLEAIADLLRRRDFRVEVRDDLSFATRARLRVSRDLWIGHWNQVAAPHYPPRYIFRNAEPLMSDDWAPNATWSAAMRGAEAVWGYKRSEREIVEGLGTSFRFVPFGYAPSYEAAYRAATEDKDLAQDIDVLFVGATTERRARVLDDLRERDLVVDEVSRANAVFGADLYPLFARSKIVLGVHNYDDPQVQIVDLARIDRCLSNRVFVVHERPGEPDSDPGFEEHLVLCDYDDIVDTCEHFAARADVRRARAEDAYEWFRSAYALDDFLPYDEVAALL